MKRAITTAIILCLFLFFNTSNAQIFYVAPNGDDHNSGTRPENPFANLQKAINEIRKSAKDEISSNKPALIYLLGGTYEMKQPIVYWKEGVLLDGNWKDEPYSFYFRPIMNKKEGIREVTETYDMDRNLYFNPTKSLNEIEFNGNSWDTWQKGGKDTHSMFADPMFADIGNFDFTLKPGSPAFQLGFKNIEISKVGPRQPTGPVAD